jgi:hypothetical protein
MKKFICNTNYQSPVQTLNAPKGGQKELLDLLVTDGNDGWHDKLYEFLRGEAYEDLQGNIIDLDQISDKARQDLYQYEIDTENMINCVLGITQSSGVYYIACQIGGDWQIPVLIFIYWDGNDYRIYVPINGNCINTLNNSAFGEDESVDSQYFQKEFGFDIDLDELICDFDACLFEFDRQIK